MVVTVMLEGLEKYGFYVLGYVQGYINYSRGFYISALQYYRKT